MIPFLIALNARRRRQAQTGTAIRGGDDGVETVRAETNPPWTEWQTKFLLDNTKTLTGPQIAQRIGRTKRSVGDKLRHMGIVREKKNFDWTAEAIALLERGIADGLSASDIARLIGGGLSRNAVLGKCHRLGLKLAASPDPNKLAERALRRSRAALKRAMPHPPRAAYKMAQLPKRLPARLPVPPEPTSATNVRIMHLGDDHCRWIIGPTAGLDTIYCGATRQADDRRFPYCGYHRRQATGGMT